MTLATTTASADVHITMADGKVTVSAKDATVGQILNEWARVGQTRIVNIDRLPGTRLSIELTNLPEAQALDTVLRSASGYLAAPRAVALANASAYDRIFVLATSSGTPARTAQAPATQGAFVPPMFEPPTEDQNREPDVQRPGPVGARAPIALPNRGGGGAFPTPIQGQPPIPTQQTSPVPPFPPNSGTPAGVSTPGMLVPSQQPPGQARPDNP